MKKRNMIENIKDIESIRIKKKYIKYNKNKIIKI